MQFFILPIAYITDTKVRGFVECFICCQIVIKMSQKGNIVLLYSNSYRLGLPYGPASTLQMLGSKGLNFHNMFSSLTAYLALSAEICGTSMPILWTVTLLRVC